MPNELTTSKLRHILRETLSPEYIDKIVYLLSGYISSIETVLKEHGGVHLGKLEVAVTSIQTATAQLRVGSETFKAFNLDGDVRCVLESLVIEIENHLAKVEL